MFFFHYSRAGPLNTTCGERRRHAPRVRTAAGRRRSAGGSFSAPALPERIPGVRAAEEAPPSFPVISETYPAALAYPAVLCYYRAVGASAPARPSIRGARLQKAKKRKGGFCVRTRASKLLSLILAAALCLSLTVTVSAAETGAGQEGPSPFCTPTTSTPTSTTMWGRATRPV